MNLAGRISKKIIYAGLLCSMTLSSFSAFAVSDQITISQTVIANDTEAPTVPQNVTATAVSVDQIDIAWDASTDNVGVVGYQVFRDGAHIATTILALYSDIGLASSTTYAYTVIAFDGVPNFSTSSATTTATTNTPVVPPPVATTTEDDGRIFSSFARPRIENFSIVVDRENAHMSWATNVPTQAVVIWGMTHEYEVASLEERARFSVHNSVLTGLMPGTTYFYRIVARYGTRSGGNMPIEIVLREGSFTTESLPDFEAPPNVSALRARQEATDVVLSWQNPSVPDFDHVRIVRKAYGYPSDPSDGLVVFEGNASEYRDSNVFTNGSRYGYAVFAYDTRGNGSSGAVVQIQRWGTSLPPDPQVSVSPSSEGVPALSFGDIEFFVGNTRISFIGNEVALSGDKPFTIRIPYVRLPEHLKTILVTLTDAHDSSQTFSFLLRITKDRSAYEAVIAPLERDGVYGVTLSVFDYKEQTISKVVGALRVEQVQSAPSIYIDTGIMGFLKSISGAVEKIGYWSIVVVLFVFLILLYFISHHKRKEYV